MGLIITPQLEIDKYFQSDAVDQSTLKKLLLGVDKFKDIQKEDKKKLYYEEKESFIIGSAVDLILTGEEEEFEKQYYVSQLEEKPSDIEMSMIQEVFDIVKVDNSEVKSLKTYIDILKEVIVRHNWYKGSPGPKRIQGLIERDSVYFEELKNSFGKQILSEQERTTIQNVVDSFKNNSRTKDYFNREYFKEDINIDVYYQFPIYFTYREIECKALLDMIIIVKNAETKQVLAVQPIDIKTMADYTILFSKSLRRFRYDIQASFYTLALQQHFEEKIKIVPFKFIVESVNHPGNPLVYKVEQEVMSMGRYGRTKFDVARINSIISESKKEIESDIPSYANTVLKLEIKGFEQLLDEYIYQSENGWKEERIVTEKDGVLDLYWDEIK